MDKKIPYRYCIVPLCTNTTVSTPEKYFFHVPNDKKLRNKWCKLMKRREALSTKTSRHCCEDHFNIESDTENHLKWRLCGGTLKLKQGVVPSKFDCQKTKRTCTVTRTGYNKRQRIDFLENLLTKEARPSVAQPDIEYVSCENAPVLEDEPTSPLQNDCTINIDLPKSEKKTQNKIIQEKQLKNEAQTQTIKRETNVEITSENLNDSFDSNGQNSSSSSYSSSSNSFWIESHEEEINHRENTMNKIENHSKLYLGIPKETYFVISLLEENIKCPLVNILITIKKIKLNDPYYRLQIDFNTKNASRIFRKTVVMLADCFKQLIFIPNKADVLQNLPIPFRRRYNNTISIIDCFEIRIEKPSNALHLDLTWSQYKGCNTIKYLVSITPDGTINFVSEGYGGRATNSDIFEDCNILELIPKGSAIMADKASMAGFKNIAADVKMYGCHLVSPPSVRTSKASTREEVIETKRIAALRMHVERSIGRIREFKLTSPHACVDAKIIDMLDNVVVICCGLANLQSKLVL